MSGLCQCGCGQPAPIARENRPARGMRKGEPLRYINGHASNMFAPGRSRGRWTVDGETGCWLWQGLLTEDGYARTKGPSGRTVHRRSYVWHKGAIPAGQEVDHTCGVRHCINPDHLEAVTRLENHRRSSVGKLTEGDVVHIRTCGASDAEHAEKYGVAAITVSQARLGISWKAVKTPALRFERWAS